MVTCELSSLNKIPYGVLQMKLRFNQDTGQVIDKKNGSKTEYSMEAYSKFILIEFNGIPVVSAVCSSSNRLEHELKLKLPISTEALHFIEESRRDDLLLNATFDITYFDVISGEQNNQNNEHSGTFYFQIKLSASEWLKILEGLNYSHKMLIEIEVPDTELPKLQGIDDVIKAIKNANDKLLKRVSPEDIITDLRSAWDIMNRCIADFDKEIEEVIDRDSKEEDNYDKKSVRIDKISESIKKYLNSITEMRKSINSLVQIGPHREVYRSTIEDAELAFRLTVSLFAFYSNLLRKISKREE